MTEAQQCTRFFATLRSRNLRALWSFHGTFLKLNVGCLPIGHSHCVLSADNSLKFHRFSNQMQQSGFCNGDLCLVTAWAQVTSDQREAAEGLLGEEWKDRVEVEVPYYLGHEYGIAWCSSSSKSSETSFMATNILASTGPAIFSSGSPSTNMNWCSSRRSFKRLGIWKEIKSH